MSWEQTWEDIGNIGNLSLVIIVVAALLYYFGKLIGDVKVEKHEKTDYYIQGLFFTLLCIALPFVLVLFFTQYLNLHIPAWLQLLQIPTLYFLCLSACANQLVKKYGALSKKLLQRTLERQKSTQQLAATLKEKNLTKLPLPLTLYKLLIKVSKISENYYVLFLFSLIIVWSYYSCISFEYILSPSAIFLSISTFLNLTFLAINFGYANVYYPPARITLENGNEINGKILKFGEFVHLIKENEEKQLLINKDKIVYVEESLWKEKTESEEPQGEVD